MKKKWQDDALGKTFPRAAKILVKMKLTLCVILFSFFGAMASESYSQTTKLSLDLKNAKVKDALGAIENQSEFFFLYSEKLIDINREVNIEVRGSTIEKILDKIFEGTNVNYTVKGRQIVLTTPEANNIAGMPSVSQQQKRVTGKVTDTSGASLPGVAVVVKGTTTGVVTDNSGIYSLSNISENAILQFSFVGMITQEIIVKGQSTINVKLQDETTGVDEVVAIGYGIQKKSTITGSIATTKGENLVASNSTNISNALAGRLPGLTAIQGNGEPGAGSKISIRGISTLGDNSVLIVIDGIARDNAFDYIDQNEIASISVLKDAAATSVYGSRAANGVILVTTKRGSSAKPVFTYNTFMGFQQPTKYPKMMNAYQYATVQNAGLQNAGLPARYSDQEVADFKSGKTPGIDLYSLVFNKQAFQVSHNLNVNGGTDAINYFASISYLDQNGLYDANSFNRYSIRSNVDAKINSNLTISTDIDANVHQKNDAEWSAESLFYDCNFANPTIPFLNPDGSPNYKSSTTPLMAKTGYRKVGTNVLQASLSFRQELPFIEGLNLEGKATFAKEFTNGKNFLPPNYSYIGSYEGLRVPYGGYNGITAVSASSSQYLTTQYRLALNYDHNFGNHHLTGLMLFEQFDAKGDNIYAFRTNFPADNIEEIMFGGQVGKDANGSSFTDGRRSYVMRGNYEYKKRYFLEASLRADGSVAFPQSKKWGYFPALSAGWLLNEEAFIKDNPNLAFIDRFKIRASYGQVGNDRNVYNGRIPTYQYLQAFNLDGSSVQDGGTLIAGDSPAIMLAPGVLPNPNITWEKASIGNLGFDASLWGGKLQFDVDLFYKRTSDILGTRIRSIPATLGAALPSENYAIMDNKGIEISITRRGSIGKLNLYVNANGSFSENRVIKLDEPSNIPDYLLQTGRPYGFLVGYKAIGFFQSDTDVANYLPQFNGGQKPGDVKYADINKDGKIDPKDRTIVSMNNNQPKMTYGFTLGGSYEGFDFNILFQGVAKANIMLERTARNFAILAGDNNFVELLDYWTPQNPNAKYPAPSATAAPENQFDSNLYLRDASFLRLRSVNVGYTLPKHLLDKIRVEKLRIYLSGTNLFVLDKLMFDPEAETGSGNYYPQQRSFNLGFNFTF